MSDSSALGGEGIGFIIDGPGNTRIQRVSATSSAVIPDTHGLTSHW